ncbi:MAG: hypothetical protein LQ348_006590 [Seirophora lacunosa]|nr:MAG: hypothetical protein LQ344_008085 [Seirophora lacunosa]KAI4173368.1 MAG: hypothetical protein LQ348_006590 [Seirophora lacunosa]
MATTPGLIRKYKSKPFQDAIRKVGGPTRPLFQVYQSVSDLRKARRNALLAGESVGFVPTMGALHQGHLALIRQAVHENHHVYVSIYVNPTQFGVNEDLSSYPRTLEADLEKLRTLSTNLSKADVRGQITAVFTPSTRDMYPGLGPSSEIDGLGSFVTITPLSSRLEGATRPVFFRGVATVCMKLFNIVQPDAVYFGQKDVQQTYVIERMVEDFHLDTRVRVVPTARETDGLAMSSRNVYLGERRRKVATVLVRTLRAVRTAFINGETERDHLMAAAQRVISGELDRQRALPPRARAMFEVDYISLADPLTLEELYKVNSKQGAVLSGAIKMLPIEEPQAGENTGTGDGRTPVRLIDNLRLEAIGSILLNTLRRTRTAP